MILVLSGLTLLLVLIIWCIGVLTDLEFDVCLVSIGICVMSFIYPLPWPFVFIGVAVHSCTEACLVLILVRQIIKRKTNSNRFKS